MGKWAKIKDFLEFIEKFSHYFFSVKKKRKSIKKVYVNCCILAQIPYLKKILRKKSHTLVPEIWTKMLSASQIVGFLNRLYL